MNDQMPFHCKDPRGAEIAEYEKRASGSIYSADVLRHFVVQSYGGIEVEDQLGAVTQPSMVLAGRHDRVCSVPASVAIDAGVPNFGVGDL